MLTISKPTVFSPDGLAARGQCNHDSPGWQLRWFDRDTPPVMVWQGAFKTCRHLQSSCSEAIDLEQVKARVEELLNTNSFTHFANQPTDIFPSAGEHRDDRQGAKKKKKKRK